MASTKALSKIDVWGAASLLIQRHGGSAEHAALRLADEMNDQNDLGGYLVWLRIREAILEMQGRQRGTLH